MRTFEEGRQVAGELLEIIPIFEQEIDFEEELDIVLRDLIHVEGSELDFRHAVSVLSLSLVDHFSAAIRFRDQHAALGEETREVRFHVFDVCGGASFLKHRHGQDENRKGIANRDIGAVRERALDSR